MEIWTELPTSSLTVGLGIPTQEDIIIDTTLEFSFQQFHLTASTERSLLLSLKLRMALRNLLKGQGYQVLCCANITHFVLKDF